MGPRVDIKDDNVIFDLLQEILLLSDPRMQEFHYQ
jgi:hypothetical protein